MTLRTPVLCLAIAASLHAQTTTTGLQPSTLRRSGDIIQAILPAAAFTSQLIERDWHNLGRFALSVGVASATTFSLKRVVAKTRPDALDRHSFPSGHAMFSFSGASFLATQYGPKIGLPAFAAASFVGFTRVHTDRHFSDDVIAGAGIGMISNWLFASPNSEGGPYHAQFEFAAVYPYRFNSRTPTLPGVEFLPGAENRNRSATARVKLEWNGEGPHQFGVYWAPLEIQGSTNAATGVRPLDYHELGIRYRYALIDTEKLTFRGGLALAGRETRISGAPLTKTLTDREVTPLLSAQAEWRFREKFAILAESDAIKWTNGQHSATPMGALRWRPQPHWNVDIGYRCFFRKRESDNLVSNIRFGYVLLAIGREF
ncbi:MAG: phosphatase PAP2 family protein [Acidobacteria bacterium]|nr:phosphatase PAP2 family protein [Acidobacteriota bacterium]